MMPDGRVLPTPPECAGDEPPPAGAALAPPTGVTRPASWYGGEIRSCTLLRDRLSTGGPYISDITLTVMAGLVPAIHVFFARPKDVDARHKSLHLGPPKAGPECRA